jgi:hypothetical protein
MAPEVSCLRCMPLSEPVSWMALGTAPSTDLGSFSWTFCGTMEASPPPLACERLVDSLPLVAPWKSCR